MQYTKFLAKIALINIIDEQFEFLYTMTRTKTKLYYKFNDINLKKKLCFVKQTILTNVQFLHFNQIFLTSIFRNMINNGS